jgi:Flp pilus assembly protein protease CpaA
MNLWIVLGAGIAGWLIGYVANWAADVLPWRTLRAAPNAGDAVNDAAAGDLTGEVTSEATGDVTGDAPTFAARRWTHRPRLLHAALALAFAVTAWLFWPDWVRVAVGCLYVVFFLTVLVIDYEHRRVLNVMLLPAAAIALGLSFLPQTPPDPMNALVGGGVGLGLFALVFILSRGHLGMGDVKLAGVIGLMLGYPGVVNALMAGILMGAAAAIFLLATRRATRKSYMAYAPYLALGALVVMWWNW